MEYFCHFHPISPARWRCTRCHRYYDHACVSSPGNNGRPSSSASCPVCTGSLLLLANESEQDTSPVLFPRQLFSSPILLMLCLLVLAAAISAYSTLQPGLLFLANQAAVFLICFHYGRQLTFAKVFSTTRQHGKRRGKLAGAMDTASTDFRSSLSSAFGFGFVFLAPLIIFYQMHWLAGLALMISSSLLVPYLLIFMFYQFDSQHRIELNTLFNLLRPFRLSLFIKSLLLYAGSIIIYDFSFHHGSLMAALMLSSALACTSLLMLLNLHAQVYQQLLLKSGTRQITQDPSAKAQLSSSNHAEKSAPSSNEIDLALKMGHYLNAVALLEQALKRNSQSVLRRQQLYLLLSELNDLEKLSYYAESFLSWMLERGKIREASQFLYRIRKHDPAFILHNLELMNELARLFTRQKKYALVLWLAESCNKRFKPGEALASLYLSASQVLVTHFQDIAKAEEYLRFVIQHCPEYPSAEAAKALLIHLQNNQFREQQLRE